MTEATPSATALPTIFALSSGHGRAGIAVVRMSGGQARAILDLMAAPGPPPRQAALRRLRHPVSAERLDDALVLYFAGPRSETGEDMAEFHLHGSPAVVRAVLAALAGIPGCRLAEPGEFARRAFDNGKLDLTAAEGLADLIDADTDAQRRQALAHLGGAFARQCEGWRAGLLEARALAEAAIDFSDEADVAASAMADARARAGPILVDIESHLVAAHRGEIIRDGFRVVLAGPPNSGKSSLLNALAHRDVAIVSAEPGTTRDVIEVRLDLGGYAVVIADTAGLREDAGAIEQEGMRRTLARAADADLVLWLVDATAPAWTPPDGLASEPTRLLTVLNKADLLSPDAIASDPEIPAISALTGAGLPGLIDLLAAIVVSRLHDGPPDAVLPTQARHRAALADAATALRRLLDPSGFASGAAHSPPPLRGGARIGEIDPSSEIASSPHHRRLPVERKGEERVGAGKPPPTPLAPELVAEELRVAADAIGRITGRVDPEEVLGLIFGRFCIGK